jgi:putative peptidoglycan lipid II flippase
MTRSGGGLGRASALLASGTIVSRILGFVKTIVLAAIIGQVGSEAGNAFAVANQLPNNVYALVAGGVLSAVLVPQIVRASLHDDGGARFIDKIVTLGLSAFLVIAAVVTVAAPLLVALYAQSSADGERGFTPEGIALATAFAYWCLPQVLFYAAYSLLGEVLNARRAFGAFTWAPVLNNIVVIIGLLVFWAVFGGKEVNSDVGVWDSSRIALLAGTATLGVVAQALILGAFWRRAGLGYRPDFRWRGVGLRRTGAVAGWTLGMIAVGQVAGIVQTRVASGAATEGTSVFALQNAWLIFMLPHSVIAVSIATAYFTRMSGHASVDDLPAVRADVSSSLTTIGLFITLASAGLVVVAYPFARVFESEFENVGAMAVVIVAFVVGLVPFSAVFVMQRVFYSLEDTRTPFFIEVIRASVFIVGALVCQSLPTDRVGLGLAILTTAAIVVQTVITAVMLRRRLGRFGGHAVLRRQVQYLVAVVPATLLGVLLLVVLGGVDADGFAQQSIPGAVLSMAAIGVVMSASYAGMLHLMRVPEIRSATDTLATRLRRR